MRVSVSSCYQFESSKTHVKSLFTIMGSARCEIEYRTVPRNALKYCDPVTAT